MDSIPCRYLSGAADFYRMYIAGGALYLPVLGLER